MSILLAFRRSRSKPTRSSRTPYPSGTTSPIRVKTLSAASSGSDSNRMLGRRLRDIASLAAAGFLLIGLPSAHVMSAPSVAANVTVASVSTARGSGTSLAVARPRVAAPGTVLVAGLSARLDQGQTVTPPSGWTLIQRTTNAGVGASLSEYSFFHVVGASEPSSYTFTFSTSTSAIGSMADLVGVDTSNPVDASSGALSSDTSAITAPSVTTTQDGDALLGLFSTSSSRSTAPPSGTAELFDRSANGNGSNRVSLAATFQLQPVHGATGDVVAQSSGSNSSNIGQLIALRASNVPPPPPANADFTLSLSDAARTVQAGGSTTDTVQIGALNGFAGTVSFGVSGLPSGVTGSFSPPTVSGSGSTTLTLSASAGAQAGTYALTVTGTSGSLIHSAPLALTVTPAAVADFSLSLSPTSVTVQQGSSATDAVLVAGVNGFSGTVTFSATGLPSGVSAGFNPASVAGAGSSTLTLTAGSTAATGTYTVTVTGTSGSLVHSAPLSLTVATGSQVGSALPPPLPPSNGTTYYVATGGSDSNPGTATLPWRTVQKALNTLTPGQRALVRAGTYTQDLMMGRSGTATAPITVAAYPGERPVLHAASTSGDTYPVQITGSYFRLQGFVIENSVGTSAANVYFENTANHIELSGNEIRYGQDQGIFADSGTSYLQILGNRIHDNGWNHVSGQHQSHGMYVEGSYDLIANNVIYNQAYGFGMQVYPQNHDTTIVDNTVVNNAHSGLVLGGSGGVRNISVRNNIFAWNGSWGVEFDTTCPTNVTADHNVFYGNPGGAFDSSCAVDTSGGGNTNANPMFVDYAGRNLHLQAGSPAADHGRSDYSYWTDDDGNSRPMGAAPDEGAYER